MTPWMTFAAIYTAGFLIALTQAVERAREVEVLRVQGKVKAEGPMFVKVRGKRDDPLRPEWLLLFLFALSPSVVAWCVLKYGTGAILALLRATIYTLAHVDRIPEVRKARTAEADRQLETMDKGGGW